MDSRKVAEAPSPALPAYAIDADAVLKDGNGAWRTGKVPDYSQARKNYLKGRTKQWAAGSLEDIVSNLVKNWEKEASYRVDPADFQTVDPEAYRFSCNGGPEHTLAEMLRMGTYSALIGETALYSASATDFETSHEVFKRSMPDGFAWEVLEVLSGPPRVALKWRHWGRMTGPLSCPLRNGILEAPPTGEMVEIFGMAVADVTEALKITRIEIFYDADAIMRQLAKKREEPITIETPATAVGAAAS